MRDRAGVIRDRQRLAPPSSKGAGTDGFPLLTIIDIDNKVRFRYQVAYWLRLINPFDMLICPVPSSCRIEAQSENPSSKCDNGPVTTQR